MTDRNELMSNLERFAGVKVLVVGDVMLDTYWHGTASRLSPEAPVPVVSLREIRDVPGGAANVAANVNALGAETVLTGVIGEDEPGNRLCAELERSGTRFDELVRSTAGRPTTSKIRVLVHTQQIVRVDEEVSDRLDRGDEELLATKVAEWVRRADVVVLSDYAKGCLTQRIISSVIEEAKTSGKTVVVDPKSRDFRRYNGATILTPNLNEALLAANIEYTGEQSADEAASKILESTDIGSILITLGEHGMKLYSRDVPPLHFNSTAREVYDVTGAGDTVVAALAVGLGAGGTLPAAVKTANVAAGLAVEKVGTAAVSLEEIRAAIGETI
jgi:D-beta-D-heptose 7-phosphate kinase / D-beta-D-heptose 1-phosphate adenosyltransferase